MNWQRLLFPYRSHLEDEILYLKQQLAQRDRRIDVLQDWMLKGPEKAPRPEPVKPHLPARGFEAYKARNRNDEQPEAEKAQDSLRQVHTG